MFHSSSPGAAADNRNQPGELQAGSYLIIRTNKCFTHKVRLPITSRPEEQRYYLAAACGNQLTTPKDLRAPPAPTLPSTSGSRSHRGDFAPVRRGIRNQYELRFLFSWQLLYLEPINSFPNSLKGLEFSIQIGLRLLQPIFIMHK